MNLLKFPGHFMNFPLSSISYLNSYRHLFAFSELDSYLFFALSNYEPMFSSSILSIALVTSVNLVTIIDLTPVNLEYVLDPVTKVM